MKDIPVIVQSHMAKRIALYGQEPEQPLVEDLFNRYSELQSTNDQAFLDAFQKLYLFMEPLSVEATQQASQVVCLFRNGTDGVHHRASCRDAVCLGSDRADRSQAVRCRHETLH